MLCETLELNCFASDPLFDIPWSYVAPPTKPYVPQELSKRHSQPTPRTQRILSIDMIHVDLKEEKLDQGLRVGQTLQHRVHEARVTKVLEAC